MKSVKFRTIQQLVEQYGIAYMTGLSVTLKGYETYMITEYMQRYIMTGESLKYISTREIPKGWLVFEFPLDSESYEYCIHRDWIDNDVKIEYNDIDKLFQEPL